MLLSCSNTETFIAATASWTGLELFMTQVVYAKTLTSYKYAGKRFSYMLWPHTPLERIQLAALIPVRHNAYAVHSVVLVRRQGARYTVSVQVLVALKPSGRRLDSRTWTALTAQRLMGHGPLVHGMGVAQLRWGMGHDAAQSGHKGSWGEVSWEVLVWQSLHLLHGGHRAAGVRWDACPGVAADIFQAGHGLGGLRRTGVHARLPLTRLGPVGGATETQRLRVAHGPIVVIVLAGWAFHVGLLVRVLSVPNCAWTKWDGN